MCVEKPKSLDKSVFRTPNPACPHCQEGSMHTNTSRAAFHPLAGHGYTRETGATHPEIKADRG